MIGGRPGCELRKVSDDGERTSTYSVPMPPAGVVRRSGSRDLQEILPNRRVEMAGGIGRGLATREDDWWEARVRASQGQR
jgi:hypothetical protein